MSDGGWGDSMEFCAATTPRVVVLLSQFALGQFELEGPFSIRQNGSDFASSAVVFGSKPLSLREERKHCSVCDTLVKF